MSDKERQDIHHSKPDLCQGLFPGTINPELRSLAKRLAEPIKLLGQTQEAVKAQLQALTGNNPDLQRLVELNNGSKLTDVLNRLDPKRVTNARQIALATAGYHQTDQTLILLSVNEALREQIENAHDRAANVIASVHKYGSDFWQHPKLFNKSVPLNPRVQMVFRVAGVFGILALLGGAAAVAFASNQNHTTPTPSDLLPSTPDHESHPTATVVKSDVPIYTPTVHPTRVPETAVAVVSANTDGPKNVTFCTTKEGHAFQPSQDTQAYVDSLDNAITNQHFTADQIVYCANHSNVVFVYDKNDLKQDPQIFMFTSENGGQLVNVSEGTMFTTPETKWIKDGLALKAEDPNKLSATHFSTDKFDGAFIFGADENGFEKIVAIVTVDKAGAIQTFSGKTLAQFEKIFDQIDAGLFAYDIPQGLKGQKFSYVTSIDANGHEILTLVIKAGDDSVVWPISPEESIAVNQSIQSYDNFVSIVERTGGKIDQNTNTGTIIVERKNAKGVIEKVPVQVTINPASAENPDFIYAYSENGTIWLMENSKLVAHETQFSAQTAKDGKIVTTTINKVNFKHLKVVDEMLTDGIYRQLPNGEWLPIDFEAYKNNLSIPSLSEWNSLSPEQKIAIEEKWLEKVNISGVNETRAAQVREGLKTFFRASRLNSATTRNSLPDYAVRYLNTHPTYIYNSLVADSSWQLLFVNQIYFDPHVTGGIVNYGEDGKIGRIRIGTNEGQGWPDWFRTPLEIAIIVKEASSLRVLQVNAGKTTPPFGEVNSLFTFGRAADLLERANIFPEDYNYYLDAIILSAQDSYLGKTPFPSVNK